jgi:hypothetical protein
MRRILVGIVLWLLAACALAQAPSKPTRVLFIGNAITSGSDIPARVAKVAEATGRAVKAESITSSGFSLDDQWREGRAVEALRKGWDIVVLQQDVPSGPEERDRFVRDVKRFAAAIREAGARPALFMAWPRADRLPEFRDAIAVHRDAAQATDATLLPVGEAWLRALGADRRLKLYSGEGTQPAALGSDLAVLTIYLSLFPAGPQEFDDAFVEKVGRALGTPAATRDLLFDAATRAIDEPLALGKPRSP